MGHSRDWNGTYELIPDGGDQRSTVDDVIRNLKVDVRERLADIVTDFNADPISLKSAAPISHTGKVLYIHPSDMASVGLYNGPTSFRSPLTRPVLNYSNGGIAYWNEFAPSDLMCGILLPTGTVIQSIEGRFTNNTAGTLSTTTSLRYVIWGVSSQPNIPLTVTQSLTAGQTATVSLPTHTLVADGNYNLQVYLETVGAVTATFFGFKITYTVPTLAQLR